MDSFKGMARLALLALALFASALAATAEEPPPLKKSADIVLLLNSYHNGFTWTDEQDRGFRNAFTKGRPFAEIASEYLDWKRFQSQDRKQGLLTELAEKYAAHPPALIATTDNAAFEFALALREKLKNKTVPIVFCGLNGRLDRLPPNVAGVYEDLDPEGSLELAFALQPNVKRVYVVQDDSNPEGSLFRNITLAALNLKPGVTIERSGGIPPDKLSEKVAALGRGDVILQANYNISSDGVPFSHEEALDVLKSSSSVPIYGLWSFTFGRGIVGGSLLDGERHGAEAAKIALKIMAGTPVSSVPVVEKCQTLKLVDDRQLARFGFKESSLPPGYSVEFKPVSFFNENRTLIMLAALVILAQTATIVCLAISTIRRRKAERELLKKNSLMKSIVANMPFDFWASDANGVCILQSKAGERLWGEIVGKSIEESPCSEAWKKSNQEVLKGRIVDKETSYEVKGKNASFRTIIAPVICEGVITGTAGMNIDISERIASEAALKRSEESLRATLDSIGDGVIAIDNAGVVTRINPAAEAITGVASFDALGRKTADVIKLIDPDTGLKIDDPVAYMLKRRSGGVPQEAMTLLAKDGSRRQIADSGALIKDSGGETSGVVVVFRDVTESCILQEQLRQTRRLETIGQLAGGVAHDFNNMLSAILGSAEMLSIKTANDPKLNRYAKIITEASVRASDLIKKLLDFSRKGKFESIPVDINEMVAESVNLAKRDLSPKIMLETNLAAENPIVIGDPVQLQNCLQNLLSNARDAVEGEGSISVSTANVELDESFCRADPLLELKPGPHVEIDVIDTGAGMDAKTLARIFEPFFTTKKVGKGSGLGLSAVYGCMKDHHGSIRVFSEPGKGSAFKLFIPFGKLLPNAKGLGPELTEKRAGEGLILVVDDEPTIQSATHGMLCELGYDVIIAKDPIDSIDIFRMKPDISLVLLDMIMPKMNGSEVFRAMREIRPDAKILIASGFSNEAEIKRLLQQGAAGFIQKPCSLNELACSVKAALESSPKT